MVNHAVNPIKLSNNEKNPNKTKALKQVTESQMVKVCFKKRLRKKYDVDACLRWLCSKFSFGTKSSEL